MWTVFIRVLQRNRTKKIHIRGDVLQALFHTVRRLRSPTVCDWKLEGRYSLKAWEYGGGTSPGLSLKALELEATMSKGRRCMSQPKQREQTCPCSIFLFYSGPRWIERCPPWILLSLLIQMLISSGDTLTGTPQNNVAISEVRGKQVKCCLKKHFGGGRHSIHYRIQSQCGWW